MNLAERPWELSRGLSVFALSECARGVHLEDGSQRSGAAEEQRNRQENPNPFCLDFSLLLFFSAFPRLGCDVRGVASRATCGRYLVEAGMALLPGVAEDCLLA